MSSSTKTKNKEKEEEDKRDIKKVFILFYIKLKINFQEIKLKGPSLKLFIKSQANKNTRQKQAEGKQKIIKKILKKNIKKTKIHKI